MILFYYYSTTLYNLFSPNTYIGYTSYPYYKAYLIKPFLFLMKILHSFLEVKVASSNPPGRTPIFFPFLRTAFKLLGSIYKSYYKIY